ncbi:hypothetical protein T484DRAFT_1839868 [Baffinella frigidus]|nr:hypothetical protein T484DRAFT_1839868 [Cryptophyta sp. CCMP2293]
MQLDLDRVNLLPGDSLEVRGCSQVDCAQKTVLGPSVVDGTSRDFRWTSGWMGLQFNRTDSSCVGVSAARQLGFVAKWGPVTYGACGDALLDTGEACDDGNTVAGDGCSPLCQVLHPTP